MPRIFLHCALTLVSSLLLTSAYAQTDTDTSITIYRCIEEDGRVILSDSKCRPNQKQETREMRRPQDAPTPPPLPQPQIEPKPSPAPPKVVYRTPPTPMYECTTDEGKTYTSDNGDGNPRLVPLWSLGYFGRPSVIGNTWIHDACHQLPQAEACDRLRDRRREIQRKYYSSLQGQRRALDKEKRGLEARLNNDCGGI